jgi:hypothetical protein
VETIESKLVERQVPLLKLEIIVDSLLSRLARVKRDALKGVASRERDTLIEEYLDILLRTKNMRDTDVFELVKGETQIEQVKKIEDYIFYLQEKDIYSLGMEELKI